MSSKVTPSSHGAQFQRDSHAPPYLPVRNNRAEEESIENAATDVVSIDISQARYQHGLRPDHSDLEDAVTFSQTQEGFLKVVEEALDQMAAISLRNQNYRESSSDRAELSAKFIRLQQVISAIGGKSFNGLSLFSGTTLRISDKTIDSSKSPEAITIDSEGFGKDVATAYDPDATAVNNRAEASVALANIQRALKGLSGMRARVNANLHRLSLSSDQLSMFRQNLSDATKTIDSIASAGNATHMARFRILGQSNTAKMAQANAAPEAAMKLLD